MEEIIINFWNANHTVIFSFLSKIFFTIIIIAAAKILVKVIKEFIKKGSVKYNLDETILPMILVIASYGIYIIAFVIILDLFGISTASLIALLGAAGLAIGLSLRDTLDNIAAGIVLLTTRPFKKGDYIEFGSVSGTVLGIDLFVTFVQTADGIFVSAPNSSVWGVPLKNYTRNGKRRMDIIVGISYSDPIEKAFEIMHEAISFEPRILKDPAPVIKVNSLGNNSVNILLRAWASVDDYQKVIWDLNKYLKEKIEEEGLSIPFPQHDIHLIDQSKKDDKILY